MTAASLQGQTLGKYRVLEPLGRGGMAQVYRAYHPQLDRYVAIKVLRSDLVEDPEFLVRFRREARAVAKLRHANIVQVYDFDVQDNTYFMVMELLEGDTLKARQNDYRTRGERMPLGEMVRILLDVLDGLAYAHGEGMIHRDIKPANILLTRRGQAVITDFGIARIVGGTQHTAAGALMGTLNYISPEQGLEGRSDARSDVYSLGIVFYEMLAGCPPFDADTPLAILMKHLHDPLPLPRQADPTIPEPFERIVLKALAKRPEDRYQSAAEMAQALRDAAAQAGVEVPESISLPLSFTTAEAPTESVAVLSGTAREKVSDAEFAKEETDTTLAQRLAAQRAASQVPPAPSSRPAWPARPSKPWSLGQVALGTLGLLVSGNLLAVFLGGLTGQWTIFARGWPMELLWVGAGLCAVLYATADPGVLIPLGIILGNGVLMSYYALTGHWEDWAFLWPLEPLLVIGTAILAIRLARRGEEGRQRSRTLGWTLGWAALALSVLVAGIALALPGGGVSSVRGSGNVVAREEPLSGFDKVEVSSAFRADIRQGGSFRVVLRVDDNVAQYLDVAQHGGTLQIGLAPASFSNVTLQAEVTMPELTGLNLSGASHGTVTGFKSTKSLDLELSGASSVQGDIEAGDVRMEVGGASTATLSGSGNDVRMKASGASTVDLATFRVANADVQASGTSNVTVHSSGRLDAEASGASHIYYLGSPTLGKVERSDTSSVESR